MQQGEPIGTIKQLPRRPQRTNNLGQIAKDILITSNHYPLELKTKDQSYYLYKIEFEPNIPEDARDIKDDVIRSADGQIREKKLTNYNVRGRNIWSTYSVKDPIIVDGKDKSNKAYSIRITWLKEIDLKLIQGDNDDQKVINPIVSTLNGAIKKVLKNLNYREMGRSAKYFDPACFGKNTIKDHNLKVLQGIKTSLKLTASGPMLQIDFASRVLREETCLQFIQSLRGNQEDIRANLEGVSVIASYGNNRIYRIADVDFKQTPKSTFTLESGQKISYIEYYQTRYNIKIQNQQQFLLVYKDKRNPDKITYLIPELMKMTGLTDTQRADYRCMQAVAEFTKLTPDQRMSHIDRVFQELQKALNNEGISIKKENNFQAHMIVAPSIQIGNRELKSDQSAFFILKDPVHQQSHIKDWFLVYQGRNKRDDEDADYFVDELTKAAGRIGIRIEKPFFVVAKDANPNQWISMLDKEISSGGLPQMIVSFIPDRDKDRLYGPLKKFCFSDKGISHQNVLAFKFLKAKNAASVASKIAQQMSAKLGYALWSIPKPKKISEKTMLVGIDIYHKLVAGKKSCMGFVAHMDTACFRSFSKPIIMKAGQEMSQEIGKTMFEAITAYFKANKYLPENIVIYRDGVGSGQVQALRTAEVDQIKRVFKQIDPSFNPQFTFIMINKKINDRFFMENRNLPREVQPSKSGQRTNPPSGTVVASRIVSQNFDFFLAAQYVTQGTCTPTHFTVLENTTDWPEELFWQLTYFQCFNYQNWSGAVRVPACVQYAHKLAYLVGDTFQGQIHQALSSKHCYL